jgi:iron complex transport system ATP-binding protein
VSATLHARGLELAVPSRTLVRGLDLAIEPGHLAVALGPNGAGKSTLLRALVGLREPDGGRVELGDRPLYAVDRRERGRSIAYLPQGALVAQDLEVVDLVMLGRTPHLSRLRAPTPDDRDAVSRALARVELEALAHRRLSTLSGGERQRAMIARLLAGDARILVLDEPTAALDVGHAFELLELLRTLARDGSAIAIALHDLELARRYADRAALLHGDGRVDVGAPADVIEPGIVGRLFGVDARLGDDGLVLRARSIAVIPRGGRRGSR